ncbi:myosin-like protein [Plasmopara halstedii]|uniref:Myosin-like protein n=1 Tax=Plasmopara halstedii TaxID=4781 RepID=A0A0P1B1L2_PLAHL|nr:myosin-like protein [Plasmopara halstedii]CEG47982.1 myosin-like protein [Plasmopara halstedii]|eukprot:XP_024584351.1 myosin-like protein [Plasmopara halstedii]
MDVGAEVDVQLGPQKWQRAKIIDRYVNPVDASGAVIVVRFEDGSVVERGVSSDVNEDGPDVRLISPGQGQHFDVDDLTQLIELDETTILSALDTRFTNNKIYTNTGAILLAVNPFQKIPNIYSKDTMAKYLLSFESRSSTMQNRGNDRMPPHIYKVAGEAYKAMMLGLNGVMSDQSILVSGESGSGKTESTKFLMEYLAQAGVTHVASTVISKTPQGIAAKVLQTNILLESFGNARTLRNDNSSRFGKFIKLHFTSGGRLTGASIQTYLLEKVRLVSQSKGERNYHIFYEMAVGAKADDRKRWFLDPPKGHLMPSGDHGDVLEASRQFLHYRYLNQSECYQRNDGVKDPEMFQRVMEAMDIVGFTLTERAGIFDTIAALMHIGNLSFEHDENCDRVGQSPGPGQGKSDLAPSCIWSRDAAATLLAVDATKLELALSVRRIRAGTDFVRMKLSAAQANNARDALAKALYGRLFSWMVTKINHFLRMDDSEKAKGGLHFIGILDIFGFEVFPKNSFEQLCINFANETLQQQFNDYVFKAEQREYESQGVDWKYIEFCDNQDCVNLISQRPTGILSLIDEECVMPKGSDTTLASKLYRACDSHPRFEASRIQRASGLFTIVHYAGHVEYSSDGFLEKNKDVLHQEAVDMLAYSTREDSFTRILCEGIGGSRERLKSSPRQRAQTSKNRGASVGLQFKEQLTTLLETLHRTNPHYVRCLKPNDVCKAGIYERDRVLNQLRCNGVMEAVRVARAGYPIRLPLDVFVARYFSLKTSTVARQQQKSSFGVPNLDLNDDMAVISKEAKELLYGLLEIIPKENDANPQGACERPDQGQFATKCSSVGIQMGYTKIFMKKPTYEFLENTRTQRLHRHMVKIFHAVLCVTARVRYLRYLRAIQVLQLRFRFKKLRKLHRRRQILLIRRKNAGKVQGFVRTVVQRKKFVRFLAVVRMLQCRFRFRRKLQAEETARKKKPGDLKHQQQRTQPISKYTESSTASSNSSSLRSVTSHSNDIEGSGISDVSSNYSDDVFTYNSDFPRHNLNTVDEQSSQLMPRASHRISIRKSQSINSITPMGGFRASQMHNTHGSQGQMIPTPKSKSRIPSRKSSFRNTRSSRAVALPRLDVIQHTSWVNDEDRFSCHICNKRFNMFKRKHHCRACGEVICNSCSLYHRIQSRSLRVCVSCVAFHSLDSPTAAGSTGFLRSGGDSLHSLNSSRKTSNGSAADRNRSSTLSSGVWLNPWPEPPYPVDEDERLTVLRELNIRELGSSGKFNMYCEVAAKTMKCPIAYVSIIEDEEQHLVANIGMAHTTLPRELSFCAHTICQPSVLVVLDTKNDERFRENPMVKGEKGAVKIRYYAGATIFSRDGHALGTVAVLDTKPRREADQEHIGMLQHLSFLASEKMTQSTIQEDSDSEFL